MNNLTNHSLFIQTCWSISASLDGAEKMAFFVKLSGKTIVSGLSSGILILSSARPLCCSGIHTSSSTGYSCMWTVMSAYWWYLSLVVWSGTLC